MKKWYLSFVNKGGFAGGCMVEGADLKEAIQRAWQLGINPGGDVMGIPVTKDFDLPMDRLMTRAELEEYGPTKGHLDKTFD